MNLEEAVAAIRAVLPYRMVAIRVCRRETGLWYKSAAAMVDEIASDAPWYRKHGRRRPLKIQR